MDRLDAALRRYEGLWPGPARATVTAGEARGLWDWVERDAVPVIGPLLEDSRFRELSRWPLAELAAGAGGAGRRLVEEVDAALVAEGRGVGLFAGRPWADLVAAADYFGPAAGLNLVGGESPRWAEFLPGFNAALRPLGDHVTRMFLLRVEHWESRLARARVAAGPKAEGRGAGEAAPPLGGLVAGLKSRCREEPPFRLRESCVTLVQAFAAVDPGPAPGWLGPAAAASGNALVFRDRVLRQGDASVTDQVAAALADVAALYRSEPDPEEAVRRAASAHDLVLVAGPGRREVYWKGVLLPADWARHDKPWAFLAMLAEAHARAAGADALDAEARGGFSAKDARQHLHLLVPVGLMKCIVPAGLGTHRLNLPPGAVQVFRVESYDRLQSGGSPPRFDPRR